MEVTDSLYHLCCEANIVHLGSKSPKAELVTLQKVVLPIITEFD